MPFVRVAVIIEESERSSLLVARAFEGFGLRVEDQEVPVEVAFMPKSAKEPALEVADFIIHTAGGGRPARRLAMGNGAKTTRQYFRRWGRNSPA